MIFHFKQRNISNYIPDLKINDITIERVHDFNFLGLTIDEHMTWKSHTHKIANKISRSLGVINSLKNVLPRPILLTLYNSLVLPHLQYSILSWGYNPGKVRTLQKRAIRLITGSKHNSHTEPLFKKLKLLKLDDIFDVSVLKFYYKLCKNTLPHYLQNMFEVSEPQHSYDTRHKGTAKPIPLKVSCDKCIRYYMPSLLQKTPTLVTEKTETHSPKGFSNYAKSHFLHTYRNDCSITNCYICNR